MHPTGAGSGELTLLVTHTPLEAHLSLLHDFFRRELSFCINTRFFLIRWKEETLCKKKEQTEYRRAGEVPSVFSAGENFAQNNRDNIHATTWIPATGEPRSITSVGRDLVQISQQNSGVFIRKEAERIEFDKFPNSRTFVIRKMNFKCEVCSTSSLPQPEIWTNCSFLGCQIREFEVLGSKISSTL